jgi:D-amino-acid oxidase
MHIVVVGAGVIGLSCAHRLVDAGHTVEIWSRDPPGAGVSAVAAAHWYPYRAFPEQAVARWSRATFTVLDESWATAVPGARRLRADELPPGYADAYRLTVPTVRMPDYLSWLAGGLKAAGVPLRTRELADLSPARRAADLVVNATGLGARELLGDRRLTPVRGQVVRVACPGLDEWTLDEGHPDGMVYVIPRGPDVICGGTAEEGAEDTTPDPATAAAILARCRSVVPELAAAEVLGHAVGLRPVRDAVRLEREGDVVHCYGHGGSGVTVSWGCADEVARLVAGTDSPAEHRSA